MAVEDKDFLDLEGLNEYDAFIKAYIDKLLAKQAQEILEQSKTEERKVVEFFD